MAWDGLEPRKWEGVGGLPPRCEIFLARTLRPFIVLNNLPDET